MKKPISKVKYGLENFLCGSCSTGIVQVLTVSSRGTFTQKVNGCLDCKTEYGLLQAARLEKCPVNKPTFYA